MIETTDLQGMVSAGRADTSLAGSAADWDGLHSLHPLHRRRTDRGWSGRQQSEEL